jgi:hypothetical protein
MDALGVYYVMGRSRKNVEGCAWLEIKLIVLERDGKLGVWRIEAGGSGGEQRE